MLVQMRWLLFVTIGQLLILSVACEEIQVKRLKTLSEIQKEYVRNEEQLWQRIDGIFADSPNNDVNSENRGESIVDLLKLHQHVFFDNSFDTSSYWRSYLLFRIANFRGLLSNSNDTLEEIYRYLYDDNGQIKYDPADIKLWACDINIQRLKENSDSLFNLTIIHNDTVFQHIQTVSNAI